MVESSHMAIHSKASTFNSMGRNSKLDYPRFDGVDFRGWWSKLEQLFEADGIMDQDKVGTVMFHLEGKALDWHHFFSQSHGGIQMLSWDTYARGLQEKFNSFNFTEPMAELVTFKKQGSVDQFHDQFVSILNQLHLHEPYTLSIFISNLKVEIGQYLRLFKPQTLLEAFMLARQVEGIVPTNMVKRTPLMGGVGVF